LPGFFAALASAGELPSLCGSNLALASETLAGTGGEGGLADTLAADGGKSLSLIALPACAGGKFSTTCSTIGVLLFPSVSIALTVRALLSPPGRGCFAMKSAIICEYTSSSLCDKGSSLFFLPFFLVPFTLVDESVLVALAALPVRGAGAEGSTLPAAGGKAPPPVPPWASTKHVSAPSPQKRGSPPPAADQHARQTRCCWQHGAFGAYVRERSVMTPQREQVTASSVLDDVSGACGCEVRCVAGSTVLCAAVLPF